MSLHDYSRIKDRLMSIADPVGFLTNLFAHSPVAFAVWSTDGRGFLTNQAFLDIFRSEPPPEYNVLEDDILAENGMLALFQRAFAGETVQVPTFWYDPRDLKTFSVEDGRRVAISMTLFPLFKENGEIAYVAATYKDHTELMLANEQLSASEERLKLAHHVAHIGTFERDMRTGIVKWTPELEAVYGLPIGELEKNRCTWQSTVHPDDLAIALGASRRAAETFEAEGAEWRVLWPDGSVHWLEGRFRVLKDDEGKPHRLIGVNFDITERKEADMRNRQSEAHKTAVIDSALDAIILMDHEGRIVEFNPAAERIFGYARDEVTSKPLADVLIPAAMRDKHRVALERYRATGEGLGKRIEFAALRKDGKEVAAEMAVVRIPSDGPALFTVYVRDITERRQAAEAAMLRRAKEATEELNAELEAFSYSVAHDLRAPLRAMAGFSAIMQEDYASKLDANGQEHLDRIAGSARHMSDIIDALLSLARLTKTEVRRERVDLTELARAAIDHLRRAAPERSVEVVIAEGLSVVGDVHLLRALLDNLLGNAWKFTGKRAPGRIELGRERSGATSTFFVRDNGAGFDMSHGNQLFAPFQRLHSAQEFEGTGIGLATVQRIVRRHGGRIWAEGAEEQGATFHFTLANEGG